MGACGSCFFSCLLLLLLFLTLPGVFRLKVQREKEKNSQDLYRCSSLFISSSVKSANLIWWWAHNVGFVNGHLIRSLGLLCGAKQMANRGVSMVSRTVDVNTVLLPRWLSIRWSPGLSVCRGHHGDVGLHMTPVSFMRKGAARVPSGHIITPSPSLHLAYCLLLLSSFALSAFFDSPSLLCIMCCWGSVPVQGKSYISAGLASKLGQEGVVCIMHGLLHSRRDPWRTYTYVTHAA